MRLAVAIEEGLFFKRIMNKKEKYISAFLDGYFSGKKLPEYSFKYFEYLQEAEKLAKKKWKQYKKLQL